MRIFKDIELVEQLGSGMSRILEVYDQSVFAFEDNFLIVTFPFTDDVVLQSENSTHDDTHDSTHDKIEKVLEFCSVPRTREEIQQYIKISTREYVYKAILKLLLASGRLKMTLPDKPKSRYQKYIKHFNEIKENKI